MNNLSLKFWYGYGVSDERGWTQDCLRNSAFFPSFPGTAVLEIPSRVRLYLAPPMVRLYWKNLSMVRLHPLTFQKKNLAPFTRILPSAAAPSPLFGVPLSYLTSLSVLLLPCFTSQNPLYRNLSFYPKRSENLFPMSVISSLLCCLSLLFSHSRLSIFLLLQSPLLSSSFFCSRSLSPLFQNLSHFLF